jgi:tetratricopeptide (TPR) repeat protein
MTPIQGQECFRQAWNLANKLQNTFFAIDAALMLALCQARKAQKEWLMQAQKLAQESKDPKCQLWLASLFLLVGWDFFDMRKYTEAYSEFQKANEINNTPEAEWALARTLRAMGKFDEALIAQKSILDKFTALGKINGHVYVEMGECHQHLKNFDEARRFFDLAYRALSENKWFADNKAHELARIQHLSKFK